MTPAVPGGGSLLEPTALRKAANSSLSRPSLIWGHHNTQNAAHIWVEWQAGVTDSKSFVKAETNVWDGPATVFRHPTTAPSTLFWNQCSHHCSLRRVPRLRIVGMQTAIWGFRLACVQHCSLWSPFITSVSEVPVYTLRELSPHHTLATNKQLRTQLLPRGPASPLLRAGPLGPSTSLPVLVTVTSLCFKFLMKYSMYPKMHTHLKCAARWVLPKWRHLCNRHPGGERACFQLPKVWLGLLSTH